MFFNSQLFNRTKSEVYQLLPCSPEDTAYAHTFGGEPGRKGEIPLGRTKRIHLFYDLDLTDPLVDIRSPRPNITRLPLYYALGNTGGPFAYRLVSNTAIRLLCNPYPKAKYVPKPYPKPFAREPIYLQPIGFDAKDPEWLWSYGALLGVGSLTERERKQTLKQLKAYHRKRYDESIYDAYANWFHDDEYGGYQEDPDLAELVRMFNPFTQGMPATICPDRKCPGHKGRTRLAPIAYLQTMDEGYDQKGEQQVERLLAGRDSGQLIWMVCPLCLSVVVENPCT
jgi:hypothetical protein